MSVKLLFQLLLLFFFKKHQKRQHSIGTLTQKNLLASGTSEVAPSEVWSLSSLHKIN